MKRIIAVLTAVVLLLCAEAALAMDKPSIVITPLDYQTGRVIAAKEYNEGENFCLRVDVDIPRFADTANMEKKIDHPGAALYQDTVEMRTGTYYITGMVGQQPAYVTVCFKDYSYDKAQTAEQLYLAQQQDKTVCATFRFTAGVQAPQVVPQAHGTLQLPKTGDRSDIVYAVALASLVGGAYVLVLDIRNKKDV